MVLDINLIMVIIMKDKFKGSMKRKLMLYVFSALVFIMLVSLSVLYTMATYAREQNIRKELEIYSNIISDTYLSKDYDNLKIIINHLQSMGVNIKIAKDNYIINIEELNNGMNKPIEDKSNELIDKESGIVAKDKENHEIYYSIKYNDNTEIVISMVMDNIFEVQNSYILYYATAFIVILVISIWISNKLSFVIVKPIRDLDFITSRIARGELNRRVKITSNDELGQLALNFNHMADELEKSLNEVNEKQNRLSAILQSMESGVVAVDNNRKIITINNYAKNIFGVKQDVVGHPVEELSSEVNFQRVFSREKGDSQEIKITNPSDKILRVRSGDIIINNHQHIGAVAVLQDITDIKKLENMRTEFVANVSHELKTPLTSIMGFAETLKEVEDYETKNKFLNIINEESERLMRLISDILLLSQIEMKQEQKITTFNVDQVIGDIIYLMKSSADKKQIFLAVAGDDVGNIVGDKDKFKQMLINLIDNGIKYSEAFDTVTVTKIVEEGQFKIVVQDTGIGIEEAYIPRLFERFYRVDKARSRAKGGTGLGLAIVKHITLGFNGSIDVESTVGVGTKFIITIPF